MTIALSSVALVDDVAAELGSQEVVDSLETVTSNASSAMQWALDEALWHLRNRVPPIADSDLADVTELKMIVVYGAIARLYRQNITTGMGDDVSSAKHDIYNKMFSQRLSSLRPTLAASMVAAPASIALHRR